MSKHKTAKTRRQVKKATKRRAYRARRKAKIKVVERRT